LYSLGRKQHPTAPSGEHVSALPRSGHVTSLCCC